MPADSLMPPQDGRLAAPTQAASALTASQITKFAGVAKPPFVSHIKAI
jgi:hypothetical protein